MKLREQRGFFLIEALVAVLIFSLGILGMIAMGGKAVSAQSDARYRTMAANLANDMASIIALNVDRTNPSTVQASLAAFQNRPTTPAGTLCAFTGGDSVQPDVVAWRAKLAAVGANAAGLPNAANTQPQIRVDTATFNRVQITVCWKAPTDLDWRQHTLVTYVN